jgi:hypothetical protein
VHGPLAVAQHLNLDVAGIGDELFDIEPAVTEGGLGFRARLGQVAFDVPRPPPPAAALISTGNPISSARTRPSSRSSIRPTLPGTVRTPAASAALRALALSPISRIVLPSGPTKVMSAASTASAKSAFSARKP